MNADDVVAWLLGPGHQSCLDEDGRPLGEQASPHYQTLPLDEAVRIYGDSRDRSGLPSNLGALRQLQGVWSQVLAMLQSVAPEAPDSMGRTFRRVSAGVRLAPLMALRIDADATAIPEASTALAHSTASADGEPNPVPVLAAALYKTSLGFSDLCAAMLLEAHLDADDPTPPQEVLFEWLDERPWLTGDRHVCSGTRLQIGRAWDALRGETETPTPLPTWFAPALLANLELEALAAAAAGIARAARLHGVELVHGDTARRLFDDAVVPQWSEALRQAPNVGAAHVSLLFGAELVPASLRGFLEAANQAPAVVDQHLFEHARDPAARLMRSLGRPATSVPTAAAFVTR